MYKNKASRKEKFMKEKQTNAFVQAMEKEVAWKQTENGADALNTTFDANLDLFATIGAMRKRSKNDVEIKFIKAYEEDPLTAVKILFYARDIEEGLGERNVFRICLHKLAEIKPQDAIINIPNIVKFGRWDDLYALVNTDAERAAFLFIRDQLAEDLAAMKEGRPVSLAAKWLKSVNTSSSESRKLGRLTASYLGLSEQRYRRLLSDLRKYIGITERLMSANNWEQIDFNKVPGGAMKRYIRAFYRHQSERFKEYIDAVNNNKTVVVNDQEVKAKINTKKLFPYEIIEKYTYNGCGSIVTQVRPEYEAMWKGLNDWIQGTENNIIVIADVSGSMSGRPMCSSVGLAIYFAERNKGPFHNKFMTFSSSPSWVSLNDNMSLHEKISVVAKGEWGSSTNIYRALELILNTAVAANLKQEDLPKALVIITDMEFDRGVYQADRAVFYDHIKHAFAAHGYELPEVVFWNVDARHDTFHAEYTTNQVKLVSGQSAAVFKSLIDSKDYNPYDFMKDVVYKQRYESVVISQ